MRGAIRDRLATATWPELVGLGWPVSLTLLVRVTMRTIDILVVGMVVGSAGVAALGIGDAAMRVVLMTGLGLGAGTITTVSQRVGAGRVHEAKVATTQSALIAVAVGVPCTVAGLALAEWYFRVLGAEDDVVAIGAPYLRIVVATAVARLLAVMLTRAFQGAGDTRTPLVVRTIGTGLNIGLTVALVGGPGPFPELGVQGAAVGTAVGNVVSAGMLIVLLARNHRSVGFVRDGWWAPSTAKRILGLAWPQIIERNIFTVGAIPLNAIVLTFGTVANAGFQIARRVQLYALLPSRGVATATSTLMGQHVGRGEAAEGERRAHGGLSLAFVVSLVVGLPMVVLARPIAGVFVDEPDAVAAATDWLRVYAVVVVFRAVYGVYREALQGAGDTRSPVVSTAVGIVVFALGASWLFGIALGLGVGAVMAGVVLDPIARVALLGRWFSSGRWHRFVRDDPDLAPDHRPAGDDEPVAARSPR